MTVAPGAASTPSVRSAELACDRRSRPHRIAYAARDSRRELPRLLEERRGVEPQRPERRRDAIPRGPLSDVGTRERRLEARVGAPLEGRSVLLRVPLEVLLDHPRLLCRGYSGERAGMLPIVGRYRRLSPDCCMLESAQDVIPVVRQLKLLIPLPRRLDNASRKDRRERSYEKSAEQACREPRTLNPACHSPKRPQLAVAPHRGTVCDYVFGPAQEPEQAAGAVRLEDVIGIREPEELAGGRRDASVPCMRGTAVLDTEDTKALVLDLPEVRLYGNRAAVVDDYQLVSASLTENTFDRSYQPSRAWIPDRHNESHNGISHRLGNPNGVSGLAIELTGSRVGQSNQPSSGKTSVFYGPPLPERTLRLFYGHRACRRFAGVFLPLQTRAPQ